jgi:plastocyanin domain-containing protein
MSRVLVLIVAALLATATPARAEKSPRRIEITVTNKGFEPEQVKVKKGEALLLVFTRKVKRTCAKDVIIKVNDTTTITRDLPLDTPVEVAVTFPRSGKLKYACSMDHIGGVVVVQ